MKNAGKHPEERQNMNTENTSLTYGFIGLGLIGGSIARAIRKTQPDAKLIAYDINPDSLKPALADGVINTAADAIDDRFRDCHYLFLCAPVQKNDENLASVKQHIKHLIVECSLQLQSSCPSQTKSTYVENPPDLYAHDKMTLLSLY